MELLKTWILRSIAILMALSLLCGCEQSKPTQVRIAFSEDAHNQILHLIKEQGIDREHGIELKLYPTITQEEVQRLFQNGFVDFALTNISSALDIAEFEQITIIGVIGKMQGTRSMIASHDVETFDDLRTRKIGAYHHNSHFWEGFYKENGISKEDLNIFYIPNVETEKRLITGEIGAVVTSEPQVTRLKGAGFKELYSASTSSTQRAFVIAGRPKTVHANESTTSALIDSWEAGLVFSDKYSQLAAAVLAPKIGLTAAEFEQLLNRFAHNTDLRQGFDKEFSTLTDGIKKRLSKSLTPSADGTPPKVLLYWEQ